jgi:adenosylcobinamide-GDP ribazoletransferase
VWFPLVGCLVGLAVGGVWRGAAEWWSLPVAAALAVAADLAITGLLHVDGLADSADGLLPHLDRGGRLRVMRAPDVGAFGVAAVATAVVTRAAALGTTASSVGLVVALWCASRTAMALIADALPYARSSGLASPFLGVRRGWAAYGLPVAGVVAWLSVGLQAVAAVGAVVVGAALVAVLAHRRIGGFTGDVLGAAGVVGETLGLVVAGARW